MNKGIKIVRNVGTVRDAVTLDGYKVHRKDRLILKSYADEFPNGIPCAPYDNHFIYLNTVKIGSTIMCTCGGIGVIANYDAYKANSSSNLGALLVCQTHTMTGRHEDGSQ